MNLRDLHYFSAVAEHLHFGQAAEACNVSQPTLSMQLKKLEEELGVMLFERSRKKLQLTPVGQQLLKQAQHIIAAEKQMRMVASANKDPFAGELSLGAFPTLAPYLLPQLMPKLSAAFPKLTIQLVEAKTADLLHMLDEGQLDCALIAAPVEHANVAAVTLFDEPFYLAVGQGHPLAKKKSVTADDLAPFSLMLLDEGHCLREQALAVCHQMGSRESSRYRATSLEMLRGMVASGREITLVPKLAIREDDYIIYIPFENPPMRRIMLCCRRTSSRVVLMKKLAEVFRG